MWAVFACKGLFWGGTPEGASEASRPQKPLIYIDVANHLVYFEALAMNGLCLRICSILALKMTVLGRHPGG